MRKTLFRRMALTNIRNNRKFYLPYLLTMMLAVAMFCNMCSVSENPAFTQEPAAKSILQFGTVVVGLFSLIFIFYTNSFLMKRRRQELGLYHILGLEKRHVARILAWEVFDLACIGTLGGIAAGVLLDRLLFLIILKMVHYAQHVAYRIDPGALTRTAFTFAGIFVLVFLYDVWSVSRASAVELLASRHAGEREPRARWLIVAAGLVCLALGYYFANTVETISSALTILFFAVLLVIAGTYCLFLCGSIAILKFVRARKNYYYRPHHFVAVSGLLYRMKQNAVGLANICILSTGVLLVVSTTVCLYAGMQDRVTIRYPKEISLSAYNIADGDAGRILEKISRTEETLGMPARDLLAYEHLDVAFLLRDGELCTDQSQPGAAFGDDVTAVSFFTADTYAQMTGEKLVLSDREAAVFHCPEAIREQFRIFGETYTVVREFDDFPVRNEMEHILKNWMQVVVRDEEALAKIFRAQEEAYEIAGAMQFDVQWNVDGGEENANAFSDALLAAFSDKERSAYNLAVTSRYWFRDGIRVMNGSMLFLGIYLGVLFLTATVLIIYYKQIIEGYEDRGRFAIMQKVGMDRREVRRAIRSQIRILFYLPLGTALIHCAAAFHLMRKILEAFYMDNARLFAGVTAIAAGFFSIGYVLVFALTSRAYYQIVSRD